MPCNKSHWTLSRMLVAYAGVHANVPQGAIPRPPRRTYVLGGGVPPRLGGRQTPRRRQLVGAGEGGGRGRRRRQGRAPAEEKAGDGRRPRYGRAAAAEEEEVGAGAEEEEGRQQRRGGGSGGGGGNERRQGRREDRKGNERRRGEGIRWAIGLLGCWAALICLFFNSRLNCPRFFFFFRGI